MQVKDDYRCQVCDTMKSCLIFTEFSLPFSICLECYVKMKAAVDADKDTRPDEICKLCDIRKDCFSFREKAILPFIAKFRICPDCFAKLEEFVENRIRYL
ncbi:MAG: hypothetical protein V1725_03890 [archaeon]